jgi:hypothetical protein
MTLVLSLYRRVHLRGKALQVGLFGRLSLTRLQAAEASLLGEDYHPGHDMMMTR